MPFQRSAIGLAPVAPLGVLPTAMQALADMHDTSLSSEVTAPARLGRPTCKPARLRRLRHHKRSRGGRLPEQPLLIPGGSGYSAAYLPRRRIRSIES